MSATATAPTRDTEDGAAEEPGGKKKLLVVVLLLALVGGAGYWFFLKPGDPAPKPGEVVALDPIQVNLADGHYLSVGIALQLAEGAHEADGSKALDAVISLYSGREIEELAKPKTRSELKDELKHELAELYHEEVMDVYLTQFVTQ
ncbi:flagellar basal body-associated FliL family protein [Nocardioides sp.]|uniref:flagellar basal body-associated FliL family protein n=1 Tax=Nocardioides sp. TaxID=35761 RepID=UPI001A309654|nr:flagellar basal body-associated FliL family protein [Nocardioides sp.]MBJ7358608.1 flagellar basal body-associated FliL family protein [Nocardioides sp.]